MSVSHLLITRFNVRFLGVSPREYPCDDTWHLHRFKIFERFTLPSVQHQTNRNFQWLICFNEALQDQYRDFLERAEKACDNITFLFVEPERSHREVISRYITEHVATNYVITTRMDNDDVIGTKFIDSIQVSCQSMLAGIDADGVILNAPNGFQLETTFPYRRSRINGYEYSPFISLLSLKSKAEGGWHIHKYKHPEWKNHLEAVDISDKPLWMQIIHSKNRANRILTFNLDPQILSYDFPSLEEKGVRTEPYMSLIPFQMGISAIQRAIVRLCKVIQGMRRSQ
jgi:hypothetical protein